MNTTQNIIIDEEFKLLLPSLDKITFESLEQSLLTYGARDPLVVWNNILIDGYNRYKICTEHNIPFTTVSMTFSSREEVLTWIIDNQISRRNLTQIELSHFRGLYFNAVKVMRGSSNQYSEKSAFHQSDGKQKSLNTAKEVGKRFNVSSATIERDSRVANALTAIAEVSPDAKRKILSGEIPVDRNKLQKLSKSSKTELEDVVAQIDAGIYNRYDYRGKKPETQEQSKNDSSGKFPIQNQTEEPYIDTIVSFISGNLNMTLKLLPRDCGVSELKSSLKTFINSLDELYNSLP